jgi:hypothetical protein
VSASQTIPALFLLCFAGCQTWVIIL